MTYPRAMEHAQVIQMQVDLMNGRSWDTRSPEIVDTPEARERWNKIAAELAAGHAAGLSADVPHELPI